MNHTFQVENIRCGGCENTITKKLKQISGVEDVKVNVEEKQVIVAISSANNDETQTLIREKLIKLGYPETGSAEANSLKSKATSVVSCAIGKVSNKN